MKKDSIIDYSAYILFRVLGPLIRCLPFGAANLLGRILGELIYGFDRRHRAIAYSNARRALGDKLPGADINNIIKDFYRTLGQNLIEIFLIPRVNKEYIDKYVTIDGIDYINEAFKRKKGVIILAVHEGSWELSSIICAILKPPFNLFVRNQRYPRLNKLLNLYRTQKGCKLIQRRNQTRHLIEALKRNEAVGITVDQGGKDGVPINFFGKEASMASGAVRLALKYDSAVILAFSARVNGPYNKIILEPPFEIKKTGDLKKDVRDNLQEIAHIFQKHILNYPKEYLWSYKIWKYSKERRVLILSDGKTGHLRQAQAVAKIVESFFKDKGIITQVDTIEVKYKNKFSRYILALISFLSARFSCQGRLKNLENFLEEEARKSLISISPDVVISCGSLVAPLNFIISRENMAKSIAILRPSILSVKRFDLAIIPKHDNPHKRKNVVVTEGALNLIDGRYLDYCKGRFINHVRISQEISQPDNKRLRAGLLIGGDNRYFKLSVDSMKRIIGQLKQALNELNGEILVTTSRRTPPDVERLVKEEFKEYGRCKFLVVANEKNVSDAVGIILALSNIIVTSPESISMISEAVSSKRYVLVFESAGLGKRHIRFLDNFARNKYVYLSNSSNLSEVMQDIWLNKPPIQTLRDNDRVREAIKKIL